jgi:hypothetical protein
MLHETTTQPNTKNQISNRHFASPTKEAFKTNDSKNIKANMAYRGGELSNLDDDGNLRGDIGESDIMIDNKHSVKKKITKAGKVASKSGLIGTTMRRIKDKVTAVGKTPTKRKVTKNHPTPIGQTSRLGDASWQDA